jgi:hypothetical protein
MWQLRIPHRDRDESLIEAVAQARELPPGLERDTLRALIVEVSTTGARNVGELLDLLETSTPAERQQFVDHARHLLAPGNER